MQKTKGSFPGDGMLCSRDQHSFSAKGQTGTAPGFAGGYGLCSNQPPMSASVKPTLDNAEKKGGDRVCGWTVKFAFHVTFTLQIFFFGLFPTIEKFKYHS